MNELIYISQSIPICFSYAHATITTILNLKFSLGLYEAKEKHKRIFTILTNLKAECLYNQKGRGNPQKPFQLACLEKVKDSTEVHEYYPELFTKIINTHQLALDANLENLGIRKMVPRDVQDMMTELAEDLEIILPEHSQRSPTLKGLFRERVLENLW
jgi:hypothetical protein